MLAVPTVEGVKCTAHVAVPVNPAVSVQVVWSKAPETPANEKATVDQWLTQVANLKADLTEIRDKAKAGQIQGVQAVVPKAQEHNSKANQLATQLGMSVCNKD